ncbi:MAG TPA: adenylate/guanylate cyclase domain-containing protein [Stellaceae bacterium]|nr:adenylate/guanylate cyclase domain-containing protein [Stellaceae bacterium]
MNAGGNEASLADEGDSKVVTLFGVEGSRHAGEAAARRLSAVAFVDIVGYTILMARDEAGTHERWMRLMAEVLRPRAAQQRGRIVKSTGDGVLAEFPSALDAVVWAREVQQASAEAQARDAERNLPPIALRISVHIGDVVETENDIYGDGVNVAARLQEHAEPGGIVLSAAVHDLVRGHLKAPPRDLGMVPLKNFELPVHAYALDTAAPSLQVPMPPRASQMPSIAVLPLHNMSGNSDDNYFAKGLVADIIVSLASLRELVVISHASTLRYSDAEPDLRAIGRALGVRYVVTGNLRRTAQLVRVSLQLWDAESASSIWAHTAEVPPAEVFEAQDQIVVKIVGGVAPHVRGAELQAAMRKRPASFTAYDHTLRALDMMNRLHREAFEEARSHLERAMALDPAFAAAYAWAARWYSIRVGQGWSDAPDSDREKAAELASRAIELDRQNALALAIYGHLKSFLFHDYESALVYFERALSASPSSSLAWMLSSATLSYVGRGEEAVRHAEWGLRLSPFDPGLYAYYFFLGLAHYGNGNYAEAVKWGRMAASENPRYTSTFKLLAASLAALGRIPEAKEAAEQLVKSQPGFHLGDYGRERQPFRDPELSARYLAHLSAAGLPD